MIIRKVKLAPFGPAAKREYRLQAGLNVILGPNEAGKSTLVNAIFAGLFIAPGVRKNSEDWTGLMRHCLPHPVGDTARVELELLSDDGAALSYSCAWGAGREERLVLDGGREINDPAAIRRQLGELLKYGRGTYQAILFARQEEMNRTLHLLKGNEEAEATVSGLLRAALFESGGVSLEQLGAAIDREEERLLGNWDWKADGPRGGRGIGNPHKRNVGDVLEAFYTCERIRRTLSNTRSDETRMMELNRQVEQGELERKKLIGRLEKYEMLEDDARRRGALEPTFERLEAEEKQLGVICAEWPRVEERVKMVSAALEEKREKRSQLELELKDARAVLDARGTRELFRQAESTKKDLETKKEVLAELKKIDSAAVAALEDLERRAASSLAVAGAMKLKARVRSERPLRLKFKAGLDDAQEIEVTGEETLRGAGRLLLESAGWSVDIQSGEQDVDKLLKEAGRCNEALKAGLEELGVADLQEARAVAARRQDLANGLAAAETRLADQLGAWDYTGLAAHVAALGEDRAVREPDSIRAESGELDRTITREETLLEQERQRLARWSAEYVSADQVMRAMVDLGQQLAEVRQKLDRLAPMPAEYETVDRFIEDLKKMRSRRDESKDRLVALKEDLLEVQKNLPDQSTEDLEAELALAEETLVKLKRESRAVRKVKEEFLALKEQLDADTFTPLVERFGAYLALATGNRYRLAEMDGSLPEALISGEGRRLPVGLLSAGTNSGVAVALRLALAGYILQDRSGFMVMDDPLVHLDPGRRRMTAELIREFGAHKQLIITTCDPQTADLLGGTLIEV